MRASQNTAWTISYTFKWSRNNNNNMFDFSGSISYTRTSTLLLDCKLCKRLPCLCMFLSFQFLSFSRICKFFLLKIHYFSKLGHWLGNVGIARCSSFDYFYVFLVCRTFHWMDMDMHGNIVTYKQQIHSSTNAVRFFLENTSATTQACFS